MLYDAYLSAAAVVTEWSGFSVFCRLLLAVLVGTVIGFNRGWNNKGAGIKTHTLVCIGAATSMILAEYVFHQFPDARADMNRIGAQVISGVGFLGVGTIIVTGRNQVRGLTTAAGRWASACIGLMAGIGFLTGTLFALLFVLVTFFVLDKVDTQMHRRSRNFDLYVEFDDIVAVRKLLKTLTAWDTSYSDFLLTKGETSVAATFTLKVGEPNRKEYYIDAIQNLDGVAFVFEV